MSYTINDGGPAFPLFVPDTHTGLWSTAEQGMSLRAYLAGQIIPVVIQVCHADTLRPGQTRPQMFAEQAVRCADALIAELAKGGAQ